MNNITNASLSHLTLTSAAQIKSGDNVVVRFGPGDSADSVQSVRKVTATHFYTFSGLGFARNSDCVLGVVAR